MNIIKKLNLGCGKDIKPKKEGWINVDNIKLKDVDILHNLNKFPYPFKNNEFDEIYCNHILEHLDNLEKIMNELKRMSKNKTKIIIRVPHFSCGVSYRDPTHKRLFSYFTFDYFTDECFYTKMNFKIKKKYLNFTRQNFTFLNKIFNPLINISPELYERFFCWIFPTAEVVVVLEVVK